MKNTKKADIHIRVTAVEKRKLEKAATKKKITLSEYILKSLSDSNDRLNYMELLPAYTEIADRLNEICHVAQNDPDCDLRKRILEIVEREKKCTN